MSGPRKTDPRRDDERLVELLDGAIDRGWSSVDAAAAERMLLDGGPETAVRWVEHVQLEVELEQAGESGGKAAQMERLAELVTIGSRDRLRPARVRTRALWAAAAAVAATVLFAVPFAWFFHRTEAPIVGSIVAKSEDVLWAGRDGTRGNVLRAGERLRLEAGLVTFELLDGTRVDLVAPVALRTSTRRSVWLRTGMARFTVPPEAVGFTLRTPEAEIVDLGTRFEVARSESAGTDLTVTRGRVAATRLVDGEPAGETRELEAGGSLAFPATELDTMVLAEPRVDWSVFTDRTDAVFGGVARVGGIVRIAEWTPFSLAAGDYPTSDMILGLVEARGRSLAGLIDGGDDVPVDSYLLHFDPPRTSSEPPRGSITFERPIAAVVTDTAAMADLDARLGGELHFGDSPDRGLELTDSDDEIRLDDDGRTIHFLLRRTGPRQLDQFRILVLADEASASPLGDAPVLD